MAQFGSPGHHVVGSVLDVDQHFQPAYFDAILLNGVLGFGVNAVSDQHKTFASLRKIIRSGGVLVVGWNNNLIKDEVVSIAEAYGFKYANPMGLPNRTQFEGSTHVFDLFTTV